MKKVLISYSHKDEKSKDWRADFKPDFSRAQRTQRVKDLMSCYIILQ